MQQQGTRLKVVTDMTGKTPIFSIFESLQLACSSLALALCTTDQRGWFTHPVSTSGDVVHSDHLAAVQVLLLYNLC